MSDAESDRKAIIDLAATYCRLVDASDFASLRDVFTPDASAELGGSGQAGIDEICGRLETALARFVRWEHHISDHHVELRGDVATARCTVRADHVRSPGEGARVYTVLGTYEDRLARTPAGWRITHRSLVVTDRIESPEAQN